MTQAKPRRDWIIAVTAALIGSLSVPLVGLAINAFKASPRVVVDMVYGPYGQLPDIALKEFGYIIPKEFISLTIENKPDGTIITPSKSRAGSDLPYDFGYDDDITGFGGTDKLIALTVSNKGSVTAKSVYVYSPYASIVAVRESDRLVVVHYVGSSGYRVEVGDLLPGQSRKVRIWAKTDILDDKPVSKIRVFYDDERLATIRRRGSDSIVSYISAYTGPTLIILAIVGLIVAVLLVGALVEAAFKFLFPGMAAKVALAASAGQPPSPPAAPKARSRKRPAAP